MFGCNFLVLNAGSLPKSMYTPIPSAPYSKEKRRRLVKQAGTETQEFLITTVMKVSEFFKKISVILTQLWERIQKLTIPNSKETNVKQIELQIGDKSKKAIEESIVRQNGDNDPSIFCFDNLNPTIIQ